MICTKCNNPGVENQALGKVFYYCRSCKNEIQLEAPKASKPTNKLIGLMEMLNEASKKHEQHVLDSLIYGTVGIPSDFSFGAVDFSVEDEIND